MRRALAVGVILAACVSAAPADAVCPGPLLLPANSARFLSPGTDRTLVIQPSQPYWNVVAVQAADPSDDYDVRLYQLGSGPEPACASNELTNSARTHGTDFVIGDFNYNAYGSYYPRLNCFSGGCGGAYYAWRDGTLLNVDASPVTHTATTSTIVASDIIQVFDVLLVAGRTYHLNFRQTGDFLWKMLLFRNPANSTYWAGRNDALIETDGCATFACQATAYYGLVVVNDYPSGTGVGSYSLGVTTRATCNCPDPFVNGASITLPGPAIGYMRTVQEAPHWSAVGLRSAGDWDLMSWSLGRDYPSLECPDSLRGESVQVGNGTEVVVSDATELPLPDTLSVTPVTFLTPSPATVDYDAGTRVLNSAARIGCVLGSQDVVNVWDLNLFGGVATRFNVTSYGTAARGLLFRNPGPDRYEAGRAQAVLTVTDTATFVAPETDLYGLVLVHEDDASGLAAVEWGSCPDPLSMGREEVQIALQQFAKIVPQDTTWWIAAVAGTTMDFDLQLYGSPDGPGYPDCFSVPGASSQLPGTQTDFIVGDFHHMPLAPLYARFFQFDMSSPDAYDFGIAQWRQAQGPLRVNGPVVADTLVPYGAVGNLVGLHEVYLYAGLPYDIHFTPSPFGTEQALLFGNPGGGVHFAPRSTALLTTNSVAAFVPAFSGMYAIVIAGSSIATANTLLWITSPVADVPPAPPTRTRLASLGPNPARDELRFGIELARPARVTIELFDVGGREVARRELGEQPAGAITQVWRLGGRESPAAGHYFVRMRADGVAVETRRVTLVH